MQHVSWREEQTLSCQGVQIGVRTNIPDALALLSQRLSPVWRLALDNVPVRYSLVASKAGRRHLIWRGRQQIACAFSLDEALHTLESFLHFDVAVRARRRLFVHAGAVGWNGRILIVPGRSRSGKTTLVEALVRAGAVYYSDEYAVIDARGNVFPYAKSLSIRGSEGQRSRRVPPECLGGTAGEDPWPLRLIAVVEYRPGSRWSPDRLSPGHAVLALLANTVVARARPRFALELLGAAVSGAQSFQGTGGDADETAAALLSLLGDAPCGASRPSVQIQDHAGSSTSSMV